MVGAGAWWRNMVDEGSWSSSFSLAIGIRWRKRDFGRITMCIVIRCGMKRDGVGIIPVLW